MTICFSVDRYRRNHSTNAPFATIMNCPSARVLGAVIGSSFRFPRIKRVVAAAAILLCSHIMPANLRIGAQAADRPPDREVDRLLIVDCLLPGQIRQLGTMATYVTARRPVKVSAEECALRGGEYVAYDRADLDSALTVWLPAAEQGDKQAQTYVGELYERGVGGAAPDYVKAARWYRKAADQGYTRAQFNLGFLYEKGMGVRRDPVVALNLYRQASGVSGIIALDEAPRASTAARVEEVRALRRELEQVRKQLDRAREELERQRGRNQAESQRLIHEHDLAKASGNVQAERRLAAELEQRQDELDTKSRQVARLAETLTSTRDRLRETERASSVLRQEVSRLRDLLAKSDKEIEARKAKIAEEERKFESLKQELERYRQNAAQSTTERDQVASLEMQLAQRELELVRQAKEIDRLEQEARHYRKQIAIEETRPSVSPGKAPETLVAMAPPTIQLIDPPVIMAVRGPLSVKVRGSLTTRELVGKVTAPAGLLSFTVNDKGEQVDPNGLFKTQVPLVGTATAVTLVAVDRMGKRAALDFTLVPEATVASAPASKKPVIPQIDFGRYHALVIGNQKYQYLPSLNTAIEDAAAVSEVLNKKYGFKVTTLLNATRYQILSALNELRSKLTEKDNLLIYYAGHGELDRANLRGHWLPVDAEPKSDANWIASVSITDILNAMTVKHVLVVADSCYSGAMTRSSIGQIEAGLSEEAREKWLRALVQARARTVLTSGGLQPVLDGGGGKHSVFAKVFLEVLWQNEEPLEAQRLYREVAARVLDRASRYKIDQQPEYAPLKFAGHEAGDFIFVPAGS